MQMNNDQEKKSLLQKAMEDYNSWCKQFNVGSMWRKHGIKRYIDPQEFDTQKFKKLIETKSWTTI